MGIISGIKVALVLMLLAGAGGGFMYVKTLKSDLAVSEANNSKLVESVDSQKAVIAQMKADWEAINKIKAELEHTNQQLTKEKLALNDRFNKLNASGKKRDLGNLAEQKPKLVDKTINKLNTNANRCIEIATGSPLTEKEIAATKKSQINPDCPSIANPNYVPYQ
jgi:hypothetical protein|tara:strand:- start:28563 stop:29057 length:495 start_codon:yes stop_codon:yes gene_type:complete